MVNQGKNLNSVLGPVLELEPTSHVRRMKKLRGRCLVLFEMHKQSRKWEEISFIGEQKARRQAPRLYPACITLEQTEYVKLRE